MKAMGFIGIFCYYNGEDETPLYIITNMHGTKLDATYNLLKLICEERPSNGSEHLLEAAESYHKTKQLQKLYNLVGHYIDSECFKSWDGRPSDDVCSKWDIEEIENLA